MLDVWPIVLFFFAPIVNYAPNIGNYGSQTKWNLLHGFVIEFLLYIFYKQYGG